MRPCSTAWPHTADLNVLPAEMSEMDESVGNDVARLKQDLALVRKLPGTGTGLQVRVIEVEGDCAWGYHEVDRWTIDPDGWSTPNLCQPAAAAVFKAAEAGWAGEDHEEREAICHCPVMQDRLAGCGGPAEDRRVTFGVRPAERAQGR